MKAWSPERQTEFILLRATGSFIILTLLKSPTKHPDKWKQTSPSSQESPSQITERLIIEKRALFEGTGKKKRAKTRRLFEGNWESGSWQAAYRLSFTIFFQSFGGFKMENSLPTSFPLFIPTRFRDRQSWLGIGSTSGSLTLRQRWRREPRALWEP